MDTNRSSLLPILSLLLLVHHSVAGTAVIKPLNTKCSTSGAGYASHDTFNSNLNQLMFLLSTQTPPIGFGLGSIGQASNRVNGLALCRGDADRSTCATCIHAASTHLRHLCPNRREAMVWFDDCLLRYSDAEFFGEVDHTSNFCIRSAMNVSNPMRFHAKVAELMSRLAKKAYLSPLLFASGEMEISGSKKLYGLAQCSRDLSGGDCRRCLMTAIRELPGCCEGRRGGRVVGASCNIRYEMHPFFGASKYL